MSLARDRDPIGCYLRRRSQQLRAGIPSAAYRLDLNGLSLANLCAQMKESVFDSLTLYESRTLVPRFHDRRRKTRVNEDYTTTWVCQIRCKVSGLAARISEISCDHDSPRQS